MKRIEYLYAKKRSVNAAVSLSELDGCVPQNAVEDDVVNGQILKKCIEDFILDISPQNRYIFLRRYFFFDPVSEIAENLQLSESAVKSSLLRSRKKLKAILEKEGVFAKVENTK